ncbi:MAG: hypothetical protein M0D55_07285 [Elusimicrobiota bacterium]|nr:MAG: hypothetical protein M0D55_07285 [Elusimicrobiota bacterium]
MSNDEAQPRRPPKSTACRCPVCGDAGRLVSALTLANHLPSEIYAQSGGQGSFCANPNCAVVYCNSRGMLIRRGDTVLPVTIKDAGDDVHVCYCFDFKRADIRREILEKGKTTIPEEIKKGIKAGRCDCERKNPQGVCCLGNVAAAVKVILAEVNRK